MNETERQFLVEVIKRKRKVFLQKWNENGIYKYRKIENGAKHES